MLAEMNGLALNTERQGTLPWITKALLFWQNLTMALLPWKRHLCWTFMRVIWIYKKYRRVNFVLILKPVSDSIFINRAMNIVYSFIFYFVILMFGLTLCLTVFVLKPARTLLYSLRTRFGQIFANEFFVYSIYLIFAIILLILGESILNFSALKNYFRKSKYRIR